MAVRISRKDAKARKVTEIFLYFFVGVLLFAPGVVQAEQTGGEISTETKQRMQKDQLHGYTLSTEKYKAAVEYARIRYVLYFISVIYGIALLLLMLKLGLAPKFQHFAERVSRRRLVQLCVFLPPLLLLLAVLAFPLDAYRHSLAVHYGLSVQTWGSWLWDWAKEQLLGMVVATGLVWVLYAVIRRSPRLWWFYFWLASLPIIVFLLFISPVIIDPLFFRFVPLKHSQPELVTQIGRVVQRGGLEIPPERTFEMKASEKLKSVNAYVTGFGASKRVVVWDTTIQKMTIPQTLFVFGHEMGHYVLNHILKTVVFLAVLLLIALYVGARLTQVALKRWGAVWAINAVDQYASLPLLFLLFSIFSFLSLPVVNAYSRQMEHEADIYGLEVVHGIIQDSHRTAAESFQILGEINLSDPAPPVFIKFWLYSHPPLNDRLQFALQYDPWSRGESPRFVK